jgi:hypothetical protein
MTKDLIAEHAELELSISSLRQAIREAGWGGGSVNVLRKLQADLFAAEDRIKAIESTRTWERQDEEGDGDDEDLECDGDDEDLE